jgi:hypothetical protein
MTLNKVLITGLGAWSLCFYLTHGPIVFAYLGVQFLTSGVFVWSMARKLKVR